MEIVKNENYWGKNCGKRNLLKMGIFENGNCGKCKLWKMEIVENGNCGKW